MALVGTAYVRVKFLEDKIEKDINAAVERGLSSVNNTIGGRIGRDVGEKVSQGVAESRISHEVSDAIEDGIDRADNGVTVSVDTDAGMFESRMKFHTRNRRVQIDLQIGKRSLKVFEEAIRRASGVRVISDLGEKLFRTFARLDQLAPILGAVVSGVASVVGLGGSLVAWIGLASAQLASILSLGLALPAVFLGGGAAIGTLVAVLKDAKTELEGVGSQFGRLQDVLSKNFWDKAAEPIRDAVDTLLPTLQTGLGTLSTSLGGFIGEMARATVVQGNLRSIGTILANTARGTDAAKKGVDSWINAFLGLGAVGSTLLPRMGAWFDIVGNKFDAWVRANTANGNILAWIDNGLANLRVLKDMLGDIIGIFGGLGKAAEAAGGGGIYTVAAALDRLNAGINSLAGQDALTSFFSASERASTILGDGISNLFSSIGRSMTVLESVIVVGASAISGAFTGIGAILESGGFLTGLNQLVTGFRDFMAFLVPMGPQIGTILGSLGGLAGTFLSALGPSLSAAIGAVTPIISTLATALGPVVTILGSTLSGALQAVMPLITALVPVISQVIGVVTQVLGVVGPVVTQLVGQLAPVLAQLIGTILPPLVSLFGSLGGFISQVVVALAPLIAQFVSGLAPVIGNLVASVLPLLQSAFEAIIPSVMSLISALGPVIDIIMQIVNVVAPILVPILNVLIQVLGGALKGAIDGVTMVLNGFKQTFDGIVQFVTSIIAGEWASAWEGLKTVVMGVITVIGGAIWTWLNVTVIGAVRGGLLRMTGLFKGGWEAIIGVFKSAYSTITSGVSSFLSSIVGFFTGGITSIRTAVSGGLNAVQSVFSSVLNAVKSVVSSAMSGIGSLFSNGMSAVRTAASNGMNAVKIAISSGITDVLGLFRSLPGRIVGTLGNLGNTLRSSGKALIDGFTAGITGAFERAKNAVSNGLQEIRNFFPFSPAKDGPFSGRGYTTFSGAALMRDFAAGLASEGAAANRALTAALTITPRITGVPTSLSAPLRETPSSPGPVSARIDPEDIEALARAIVGVAQGISSRTVDSAFLALGRGI